MRLHILGDLHLEFGPVNIPPTDADLVILAGDIHVGPEGLRWIQKQFADKPVVYILGNHEFYHHSLTGLLQELRKQATGTNIHMLENSAVEINGYVFLGCTLWTDFQLLGDAKTAMLAAEDMMSDYRIIQFDPENRVLRARDTARLHQESVTWLRRQLTAHSDGHVPARTIVVTHHAPSARSEAPCHVKSPLSPAFASNLDSLVEQSRVPLWIHGHTHHNIDYHIGSTRVLTNQRGYPEERCEGFDPGLVVDI